MTKKQVRFSECFGALVLFVFLSIAPDLGRQQDAYFVTLDTLITGLLLVTIPFLMGFVVGNTQETKAK